MGRVPPKEPSSRVQDYKKVKFTGRDIWSLAAKGLNKNMKILQKGQKFDVLPGFWTLDLGIIVIHALPSNKQNLSFSIL